MINDILGECRAFVGRAQLQHFVSAHAQCDRSVGRSVDDVHTNRVGIDLANTWLAALAPITCHIWSRPVVCGPTLRMRWNVRTGERIARLGSWRNCRSSVYIVMPEEEDLIDKACVYLLEHRYPDGCSGNAKRIIRRKAETSAVRDEEVFYMKARKDSDGKKVFHDHEAISS